VAGSRTLVRSCSAGLGDGHNVHKNSEILDGNNNIELMTTAGISGGSVTFNTVVGDITQDGTAPNLITWLNVGPPPTAASAATGGTSGIIMDNTVGSGTLAGASQIYFYTLSGGCGGTDDVDGWRCKRRNRHYSSERHHYGMNHSSRAASCGR
jgi:hypothetical protein